MFKSVRFRLTLWFVFLSSAAYLITTLATGILFHEQLTRALDYELTELLAENLQKVHYENKKLSFDFMRPTLSTKPIRMLASIQLFDDRGRLLQSSGSQGVNTLLDETTEVPFRGHHMRGKVKNLYDGGRLVGYLQVQLPTDQREQAENERFLMLMLTAPVLLCLLAASGYYFTALTTKPVEEAFSILRTFMINAGHELNTPLSISQAVVDNLNRNGINYEELPRKISIIDFSLTRMRNLVDDMIILARLDSERVAKPEYRIIALHELLTETVEHMQPLFDAQNISVKFTSLADVYVRGNMSQLQQLLTNLLQNAASYNKPDGSITLDLRFTQQKAALTISDTGIGIPAEDLPKVFDRFFRVENSRSRETGGSGLGLSIVKAVVVAHNGTINIESKVDVGTCIYIALPLAARPESTPIPTHSPPNRSSLVSGCDSSSRSE